VEGQMEKPKDTFKDYLEQNSLNLVYVSQNKVKGKLSITSYEVMKEKGGYSLLDVNIDSGRKNQIRVQLGHRGHYVIGDDKYGEPSNPLGRLGLHAYELALTNPLTGKR
jgi:23S rRNA pseudouridine1911/1915/1917 synthase